MQSLNELHGDKPNPLYKQTLQPVPNLGVESVEREKVHREETSNLQVFKENTSAGLSAMKERIEYTAQTVGNKTSKGVVKASEKTKDGFDVAKNKTGKGINAVKDITVQMATATKEMAEESAHGIKRSAEKASKTVADVTKSGCSQVKHMVSGTSNKPPPNTMPFNQCSDEGAVESTKQISSK